MGETAVFTTRGCWEVQSIELKETIVLLARTLCFWPRMCMGIHWTNKKKIQFLAWFELKNQGLPCVFISGQVTEMYTWQKVSQTEYLRTLVTRSFSYTKSIMFTDHKARLGNSGSAVQQTPLGLELNSAGQLTLRARVAQPCQRVSRL